MAAQNPGWPLAIGTIGIGMAWTFIHFVFLHPFKDVPLVSATLKHLPFSNVLPYILAYTIPIVITIFCLIPICKGLQILYPEEFDPYNEDD